MGKMIFLDTSFILAMDLEKDQYHNAAVDISKGVISGRYGGTYISDYIFDEVLTFVLAKTKSVERAVEAGKYIGEAAKILKVGGRTFDTAWQIFKDQKGTKFSFTDCTTMALMEENGIGNIATFDEEFSKVSALSVVK